MQYFKTLFLVLQIGLCLLPLSLICQENYDSVIGKRASNDPFIKLLNRKTSRESDYSPIEKVYLHTDKSHSSVGETIWYSAYMVVGPFHLLTSKSKVLYVDLVSVDGEVVLSQTHELKSGRTGGSLTVPKNIQDGHYMLRAYTQWMQNFDSDFFFRKTIHIGRNNTIPSVPETGQNPIDLQFLPEGGQLVADLVGKVSFRAVGTDGLPRVVKGRIVDQAGRSVTTFKTFDRGAGHFQITPKKNEQYTAVLDNGVEYPLPEIKDVGYSLTVENVDKRRIRVFVQGSAEIRNGNFYVVGFGRQQNYFAKKFEFENNRPVSFEIPKKELPSGVLTLTVFDTKNKPWCERAVFINNREEPDISTNISSENLKPRGKLSLKINVSDAQGNPLKTAISVAISDKDQVKKDSSTTNLVTHLLLQSELKGDILNPGLLFLDQKRETLQKLDLVMLTHGWRKYNWPEVWKDVKPVKEFSFEKALSLSGMAMSTKNKPLPNLTLNVFAKAGETLGMLSSKTALDGSFSVDGFNFQGTAEVVFNALDYNGKPLDLKVSLDPPKQKAPLAEFKGLLTEIEKTDDSDDFSLLRERAEKIYSLNKITVLDEVVVTENKKEEESRNQSPSAFGMEPDNTVYSEDNIAMQTLMQMVQLLPGVMVMGDDRRKIVKIMRGGAPLWVLNGVAIPNSGSGGFGEVGMGGGVPAIIENLPVFDVERLEILKPPRSAIWGARGAGGVILVYTKKGEGRSYNPVLSPEFSIAGHAFAKEFYSPKYDVEDDRHTAPDYRATLYWNPLLATDENGNASIEFFNSDNAEQLQVQIEGLSDDGIPGTYLKTYGEK